MHVYKQNSFLIYRKKKEQINFQIFHRFSVGVKSQKAFLWELFKIEILGETTDRMLPSK